MNEFEKENLDRADSEYWIDEKGKILRYEGSLEKEIISIHSEIAGDKNTNQWIKVGCYFHPAPLATKLPNRKQIDALINLGLLNKLVVYEDGRYLLYKNYIKSEGGYT